MKSSSNHGFNFSNHAPRTHSFAVLVDKLPTLIWMDRVNHVAIHPKLKVKVNDAATHLFLRLSSYWDTKLQRLNLWIFPLFFFSSFLISSIQIIFAPNHLPLFFSSNVGSLKSKILSFFHILVFHSRLFLDVQDWTLLYTSSIFSASFWTPLDLRAVKAPTNMNVASLFKSFPFTIGSWHIYTQDSSLWMSNFSMHLSSRSCFLRQSLLKGVWPLCTCSSHDRDWSRTSFLQTSFWNWVATSFIITFSSPHSPCIDHQRPPHE